MAFALALAIAVSLFHDLPALAGGGGSDPIPVAVASSKHACSSARSAGSRPWLSLSLPYDGSVDAQSCGYSGCFQRFHFSAP